MVETMACYGIMLWLICLFDAETKHQSLVIYISK